MFLHEKNWGIIKKNAVLCDLMLKGNAVSENEMYIQNKKSDGTKKT